VISVPQVADAQDEDDNHNVTVNVSEISRIDVEGAVDISIGSGDLETWVEGDDEGDITEITTNAPGGKTVDVSLNAAVTPLGSSPPDSPEPLSYLALRVSISNYPGSSPVNERVILNSLGSRDGFDSSSRLINVETLHGGTADLTYEAKATPEYDPSYSTEFEVEYTLTSSASSGS
jgi:hypothetical protein